jgi:signal transduction histidine kinase
MNSQFAAAWSLRTRLAMLLITLAALFFAVSAAQSYVAQREIGQKLFDDSLRESAGLLLQLAEHEITEHGLVLGVALINAETHTGPYAFRYQIWTEDMRSAYRSASLPTTALLPINADGHAWARVDGQKWRAFALWNDSHTLQIQIAQAQQQRLALNRNALLRAIIGLLVLLALAVPLIWLIVSASIRPLRQTALWVGERTAMDLRPVDATSAPSEIQPLIGALNRLLERIRDAFQVERRFTADAAHELRTPLAAIRANAQVLLGARNDEERDATAQDLLISIDRSGRLIEQLLALARADTAEGSSVVLGKVDLNELVTDQCAEQSHTAERLGVRLLKQLGPAVVSGDDGLLAVMLRNLIDNALRYSPNGEVVTVTCRTEAQSVVLEVMDRGPGVSRVEQKRIFERFYRVPGQKVSGSGLGLSIVRRIADLHAATITVADARIGQGFSLRVLFPLPGS